MKIEKALKTMEHWIEYEKANKNKINKSEELIEIQETILSDYKRVLEKNKKQEKLIEKMKQFLLKENKMCDFLESEE